MVMFIYRPEYYGDARRRQQPNDGVAEIIVAKHRRKRDRYREAALWTGCKFTDLDQRDFGDSSPAPPSGSVVDYQSNRIIVGSRMNDMPEEPPF